MHKLCYGWVVALAAALVGFGGSGARFSFGVFLKPVTEQFGWDRSALSLAASITLLLDGLLRPLAGWLVDHFGVRIVLAISLVISACTLRNLGLIFGTMFMAMIFGSSTGAYINGLIFDLLGSYQAALYLNIGAGIAAGLVILSIPGFREPCAKHRNLKFLNSVHEKRRVRIPAGKPLPAG